MATKTNFLEQMNTVMSNLNKTARKQEAYNKAHGNRPSVLLPEGYADYDAYKAYGSFNRTLKNNVNSSVNPSLLAQNVSKEITDPNPPRKVPANADVLMDKYDIKGNERVELNLGKYNESSKFIPQSLTKTLIGKAAGYALSKGDYFGGITFLCEGVYPRAFYFDPASGGTRGILVNTHPGITLSLQSPNTIRNIFKDTSISHLTEEIVEKALGRNKGISPNMKAATLRVSDYYDMFNGIQGYYSQGVVNALTGRFAGHPLAKQLLAQGESKKEIMKTIQEQLPPASYSVLQQLSYKYGVGGIKKFGKLLDSAISAALDPERQDQHLANGAKHIVYQYKNSKGWIQDTRVMNIHRLFYTSGQRFSPELNLKLITGKELTKDEEVLVSNVAKKAGVSSIIKDGKLELPNSTPDTIKQANSDKIKFNEAAINKGITTVNQNYKPIPIEEVKKVAAAPKVVKDDDDDNDHIPRVPKVKAPKQESSGIGACTTVQCMMIRR